MDPITAVILAVLSFAGALATAFFAWRSKRVEVVSGAEIKALERADERLSRAMDRERAVVAATEDRLQRGNDARDRRIDELEADLGKVVDRLEDSRTALGVAQQRVVELTWALQRAGIDAPSPPGAP